MQAAVFQTMRRTHAYITKLEKNMRHEKLLHNPTYKRKYQPLPKGTLVPVVDTATGKWDFWELFAGKGKLTKTMKKLGLKCGPIITRETGWEISLESHQATLWDLYETHKPTVLFGAPNCGPWSSSNTTMDYDTRELIRDIEREVFMFFKRLCECQHRAGRGYLFEQPRSSELLRQKDAVDLVTRFGASDFMTCMCAHGLCDIETKEPNMKQTTLRGNFELKKVVRWCSCTVPHKILQGHTSTGAMRTELAQDYTDLFCGRLGWDILQQCKSTMHKDRAFPQRDEVPNPSWRPRDPEAEALSDAEQDKEPDQVTSDPYQPQDPAELTRLADKAERSNVLARAKREAASRAAQHPGCLCSLNV